MSEAEKIMYFYLPGKYIKPMMRNYDNTTVVKFILALAATSIW